MTEHDIFFLRLRSLYLAVAIKNYVDRVAIHPAKRWKWEQCIKHSIGALNDMGIEFYSFWRTLQRWHRCLVLSKQNTFVKPRAKTKALPRFFCDNPDAKEAFKQFGLSTLKDLSVEAMHGYVHDTLIPEMLQKMGDDDVEPETKDFLKHMV
jgi:hypothetical protein